MVARIVVFGRSEDVAREFGFAGLSRFETKRAGVGRREGKVHQFPCAERLPGPFFAVEL